jgi:hypothetical protein
MPAPQIHRDCRCMALHFDLHPQCENHSEEGVCVFFSSGFDIKGSDGCDVSRKILRSFSSISNSVNQ